MPPASDSSSEDEDWAKFAAVSVTADQVNADHQKAAKQGQQKLSKLAPASIGVGVSAAPAPVAGKAAGEDEVGATKLQSMDVDGADGVPGAGAMRTAAADGGTAATLSWREMLVGPLEVLTLTQKKIATSLDKILEARLKFKRHKGSEEKSESSGKRSRAASEEAGTEQQGSAGLDTAAVHVAALGQTEGTVAASLPEAREIDYGPGVRLFKRVVHGAHTVEYVGRTLLQGPQQRVTPHDLLQVLRAKRARWEACEAVACAAAGPTLAAAAAAAATAAGVPMPGITGEGGVGLVGLGTEELERRARKAEKRAHKEAKRALKELAVEGAQVEATAAAGAARSAAGAGLTLPGDIGKVQEGGSTDTPQAPAPHPLQGGGDVGVGGGAGGQGAAEGGPVSATKKKKKKKKSGKLVPAPGTVVEAKEWVPFDVRTARLLGK